MNTGMACVRNDHRSYRRVFWKRGISLFFIARTDGAVNAAATVDDTTVTVDDGDVDGDVDVDDKIVVFIISCRCLQTFDDFFCRCGGVVATVVTATGIFSTCFNTQLPIIRAILFHIQSRKREVH